MNRPPKKIDPIATLRAAQSGAMAPPKTLNKEAEDFRHLEDTRSALFGLLANDFRQELVSTDTADIKTPSAKQNKEIFMEKINATAIDLNHQSMAEGAQVVATAALNCILLLKEEMNKLSFQLYTLNKKNIALAEEINKLKANMSTNEGIDT